MSNSNFHPDDQYWYDLSVPDVGMNYTVYSLTVYNGELIVGGYFTTAGGVPVNYIARWDKPASSCCVIRGDVDHSGVLPIDIADLVYLVDYMFNQGPAPLCFDEGDIDGSAVAPIDIADLVYLVDYMFNQGPAPPPCP